MPELSIVLVNWNAALYLRACLQSIIQNSPPFPYEVIVVDNASEDGSASLVEKDFSFVLLIKNKQNTGFARAANQGWQSSQGKYTLFLNPDTLLFADTLKKAVEVMEKEKGVGILGGLSFNGKGEINPSAYPIPSSLRLLAFITGLNRLFAVSRWEKAKKRRYSGYIQGSFLLIRRQLLEELGGFDENFFMYGEDIDLCLRAWKKGWKVLYDPEIRLIHYGGKSRDERWPIIQDYIRSFLYFYQKHFGISQTARIRLVAQASLLFLALSKIVENPLFPRRGQEEAREIMRFRASLSPKIKKPKHYPPYFYFAGIRINNFNHPEALAAIEAVLRHQEPSFLFTPNAHHIILLQKDESFRQAYQKASLVFADGMSLLFASYLLGTPLRARLAGADIFSEICGLAASLGQSVFLLGGERGEEQKAIIKIKKFWPRLRAKAYSPPYGFENDPQETEKIIQLIREFSPDILLCFLGSPKTEKWLSKHYSQLPVSLAASLGAALSYFIGRKKRAPSFLRRLGLEWLWRFAHEPRRLWKRYLIGNALFLGILIKELNHRWKGEK